MNAEFNAIKKWGPSIAISLHLNSTDGKNAEKVKGYQFVIHPDRIDSLILANHLDSEFEASGLIHFSNKILTTTNKLWCKFEEASLFIEAGFMSSKNDAQFVATNIDKFSSSIASVIYKYIILYCRPSF